MRARLAAGAAALMLIALLSACTPAATHPDDHSTTAPTDEASETADPTASPSPIPTSAAAALPTDCRAILSKDVLAQLDGVPLNDAAFGASGVGPEGTLTCIWADPAADTTSLVTTISRMSRGPALELLNGLVTSDGFTCFTPDDGTRCEKTWQNAEYPVIDGRTLFWRDDVLIDTRYSNLAPTGYTSSIIEHLFG